MSTAAKPASDRVRALMAAVEAERLACKLKESELGRKELEMKKVKNDAGMLVCRGPFAVAKSHIRTVLSSLGAVLLCVFASSTSYPDLPVIRTLILLILYSILPYS